MRYLKFVLPAFLLVLSTNVSASFIDNGSYTTVNGLDWLDFTSTVSMDQTTALSTFSGYRTATLIEMEGLMNTMFNTTFVWGANGTASFSGLTSTDLINYKQNFGNLFGFTSGSFSYASVEGLGLVGFDYSAYAALGRPGGYDYPYNDVGYKASWNGVALVRDVSTVPVPAAAWLFGSALLGFFGFSRRKANA